MLTVKMTARSLRCLLGDAFDEAEFEDGQRSARQFAFLHPDYVEDKVGDVQSVLSVGIYEHRSGPSYWIGYLAELDSYLTYR